MPPAFERGKVESFPLASPQATKQSESRLEPKELDDLNKLLSALGYSYTLQNLNLLPAWPSLSKRTLVMIDDEPTAIALIFPLLFIATAGKASFIFHHHQSKDELVAETLSPKPDIILVDYFLAQDLRGNALVRALADTASLNSALIVGFSSAADKQREFLKAGAAGFVLKDKHNPVQTVNEIEALLIQNHE